MLDVFACSGCPVCGWAFTSACPACSPLVEPNAGTKTKNIADTKPKTDTENALCLAERFIAFSLNTIFLAGSVRIDELEPSLSRNGSCGPQPSCCGDRRCRRGRRCRRYGGA